MSNRFDDLFSDDDTKTFVNLTYVSYGKTHSLSMELDEGCTWDEILNPVITTLESAFGYSFDLDREALGIYYPGKEQ